MKKPPKYQAATSRASNAQAAIVDLMQDLGHALNVNPDILFLGGGNPARIPEFENVVASHLARLVQSPDEVHKMVGVYQSPRGSERFIHVVTEYLNAQLRWNISSRQVAITNGSQSAFYILINMFLRDYGVGKSVAEGKQSKQWLLPLMPEYLGYADQATLTNAFRSVAPHIEHVSEHRFKYRVDFQNINVQSSDVAMCVSRPTNPTGNVLTEKELAKLSDIAREADIPLVVDCAYGAPFPGIFYTSQVTDYFPGNIYVFSCSKLGLPGVRTGIIVGPEEIIEQLVNANTVMSLANGNFGPSLMTSILEQGHLPALCRNTILPFYRKRRDFMLSCIEKYFDKLNYKVHEPEGAFFIWLWFPELKISSTLLYERAKSRGVLIMDGRHFFFGGDDGWEHSQQCIRLSYCQSEKVIDKAIKLLAEELHEVA